jgi:DNA-binding IclR family transcriptional regulator
VDREAATVLDALGWEPATVGQVADRADVPLATASLTLAHLERDGWVARRGPWWERRPSGV